MEGKAHPDPRRGAPPLTLQRTGGAWQAVIERPEDLGRLAELDEALWVASSLPIASLNCDPVFLKFVDSDGNGRIRSDEFKAAQQWLFRMLADRRRLAQGSTVLELAAIDAGHEEGRALRSAAELVLENLGASEAGRITLEQVRDRQRIVAGGAANGDGVIPPEAAGDPELAAFIGEVIAATGGAPDASGAQGVSEELLDRFLDEARACLAWQEEGRLPAGAAASAILPWGEQTPAAWEAASAVAAKLDEYFALCAMCRLDARVAGRAALADAELAGLDSAGAAALEERMRRAPLAAPRPEERLALGPGVNPAWRRELRALAERVLPLAGLPAQWGAAELARADWERLRETLAPYGRWLAARPDSAAEKLGEERLRALLAGGLPGRLRAMIAEDRAVAAELAQVQNLERLILYQQWLMELANNFAAFPRLYDPERTSLVEAGALVMGGRRYTLTVAVADRAAHRRIAELSHICLLYLELARAGGERRQVAAAVTAGSTERLCAGRRGVFFTADGRAWDAEILEVLTNPVDVWEAVCLPFKRLGEFVGRQAERFTAARYGDLEKRVGTGISGLEKGAAAPPPPAAVPEATRSGAARDLLMGGSVAVAALGGAFAFITRTLAAVKWHHVLVALGGILLVIVGPAVIMAFVKLRRRNISMLLEACGWAVNANLRLTGRLGRLFSFVPAPPADSRRRRGDLARRFLRRIPGSGSRALRWLLAALAAAGVGAALGLAAARWLLGLPL